VAQARVGWSMAHWFAPYVAPQRQRPLYPAALAVRVDDPPFDARRLGRLASIVSMAQPRVPDRVLLRYVIQEGPAFTTTPHVVCGSITISALFDAEIAALPRFAGSAVAGPKLTDSIVLTQTISSSQETGPKLGGDPDVEECD
jgi:hypothetical protein